MIVKFQTARIKTNFRDYNNAAFSASVEAIIAGINGNINFPLTQPMLASLSAARDTFNTAMADAANRDKALIGIRNTARIELALQITSVASSVTFEAQGSRDKLLGSNFELYKTRDTPAPVLGAVTGFKVLDALPAGLTLICGGVKGVKTYTHQITPDPLTAESVWAGLPTSSRQATFAYLPSGKKFWCRIIVTGTKGQVSYSDTLSRITQ